MSNFIVLASSHVLISKDSNALHSSYTSAFGTSPIKVGDVSLFVEFEVPKKELAAGATLVVLREVIRSVEFRDGRYGNVDMKVLKKAQDEIDALDEKVVKGIRSLCLDTVQGASSGHPGAPMGLAPAAHVLFSRFLNFSDDVKDLYANRDRFVLSCGHASALLYVMLNISSNAISVDDLKNFRQLHSKTPGHPESDVPGIETTTGPLGQGIANAVGLSLAREHVNDRLKTSKTESLIDHKVFAFCSDGDLMEGVSYEAIAFAGHQKLSSLICLYDDNKITIDGKTDLAWSENIDMRFQAAGWNTLLVEDGNDLHALTDAFLDALTETQRPTLIRCRTTIGFGTSLQGTAKVHGAPVGWEEISRVKKVYGYPDEKYYVEPALNKVYTSVKQRYRVTLDLWNARLAEAKKNNPEVFNLYQQLQDGKLDLQEISKILPKNGTSSVATRKCSQISLNALATRIPGLLGGSADLTPSNLTNPDNATDFSPRARFGRYIRFGIREHGMGAIGNGISYYGMKGLIPYVGTFFIFAEYGMPAIRMAALADLAPIWVLTHDSVFLGEDGKTHQPINTLATVRALPNCYAFRPADQTEVSGSYLVALEKRDRPSLIILTRQNLPPLENSSFEGVSKGAYEIYRTGEKIDVQIVATGSEVSLAIETVKKLKLNASVISMVCFSRFDEQSAEYKQSVLANDVPRISVEASTTFGWRKYVDHTFGIDEFGVSAPLKDVQDHFGFTVEKFGNFVQSKILKK